MTPEGKVKKKITDLLTRLEKEGAKIHHEVRVAVGPSYKKGLPDLWLVINGQHIEIEVKREEGGVLSTMQIKYQKYFNDLGIPCYVVSNLNEFKEILKKRLLLN